MYYVYIIKSLKSAIYYTGIAKDVNLRLTNHNKGKSKFTKGHLPWELIYFEGPYETKKARKIEKFYKSTSGKRELKTKQIII